MRLIVAKDYADVSRKAANIIAAQIQLKGARLSSGHIKLKIFLYQSTVTCNHFLCLNAKLFPASARIRRQNHHPFP